MKVDLETSGMKVSPETIVKVGSGAWSDVKVGPETRDVKVGPETLDVKVGPETSGMKVGAERHRPRHLVNREGRPKAWSDVKVGPETRDLNVGPETLDRDSLFCTCTAYGLVTGSVFGLSYLLR